MAPEHPALAVLLTACPAIKNGLPSTAIVRCTAEATRSTLTIERDGSRRGNVTSDQAGIDLDQGDVSASFADGIAIRLTANAAADSVLRGWSGACADEGVTCIVALSLDTIITTTFDLVSRPMVVESDTSPIAGTTVTLPLRGSVDVSVDSNTLSTASKAFVLDLTRIIRASGSRALAAVQPALSLGQRPEPRQKWLGVLHLKLTRMRGRGTVLTPENRAR